MVTIVSKSQSGHWSCRSCRSPSTSSRQAGGIKYPSGFSSFGGTICLGWCAGLSWTFSALLTPDFSDRVPHPLGGDHRFLQRALTQRFHPIAALGAPAPLRRRIGEPTGDQSLVFETIEGHVDGSQRDTLGPGEIFHFVVYRDAVS